MASDHAEMGHADHLFMAFLDEREGAFFIRITWPFGFDFIKESFVDIENDLQVARQDFAEEADAPLFQSLGHECVVRVSKCAAHDPPSLRP